MNKRTEPHIVATALYPSPCGRLLLGACGDALCLCTWADRPCAERCKRRLVRLLHVTFEERPSAVLQRAMAQLDEYFSGERTAFDLPLLPVGTPFQQSVWRTLSSVPYGATRTYLDVARTVGNVRGVRAVAQAIGANAIGIIVPCHRIVGADRSLTGFAGGLEAKAALLRLESGENERRSK